MQLIIRGVLGDFKLLGKQYVGKKEELRLVKNGPGCNDNGIVSRNHHFYTFEVSSISGLPGRMGQ